MGDSNNDDADSDFSDFSDFTDWHDSRMTTPGNDGDPSWACRNWFSGDRVCQYVKCYIPGCDEEVCILHEHPCQNPKCTKYVCQYHIKKFLKPHPDPTFTSHVFYGVCDPCYEKEKNDFREHVLRRETEAERLRTLIEQSRIETEKAQEELLKVLSKANDDLREVPRVILDEDLLPPNPYFPVLFPAHPYLNNQ